MKRSEIESNLRQLAELARSRPNPDAELVDEIEATADRLARPPRRRKRLVARCPR